MTWKWLTNCLDSAKTAMTVPPVWIDGSLYVMMALTSFLGVTLSSDESYKYINPVFLYWLKMVIGGLDAMLLALKLFRSTTYGDHKQEQLIKKQPENG